MSFDHRSFSVFFFFNDTATTEIYTLSLHDALPISATRSSEPDPAASRSSSGLVRAGVRGAHQPRRRDRKSTRLNSSHSQISYAVFCLKKKKQHRMDTQNANRTHRHDEHQQRDLSAT